MYSMPVVVCTHPLAMFVQAIAAMYSHADAFLVPNRVPGCPSCSFPPIVLAPSCKERTSSTLMPLPASYAI
jgi:hypothetical protein